MLWFLVIDNGSGYLIDMFIRGEEFDLVVIYILFVIFIFGGFD